MDDKQILLQNKKLKPLHKDIVDLESNPVLITLTNSLVLLTIFTLYLIGRVIYNLLASELHTDISIYQSGGKHSHRSALLMNRQEQLDAPPSTFSTIQPSLKFPISLIVIAQLSTPVRIKGI